MDCAPTSSSIKQEIDHEVVLEFHRTKIYIIEKVLLHGHGEKTFEAILLLLERTYSLWSRSLMNSKQSTINRSSVEENWLAVME